MRRTHAPVAGALALALGLPLLLCGGTARADDAKPKYKFQPLNLHKEQLGTEAFASAGRTRMRNGDCAGALEAFDAALRTSVDPSIRRDRGLCHERLGNVYPAMDDLRAYVVAEPDAPDADSIRQRLARLEQATLGHSSEAGPGADSGAASSSGTGGVGGGAGADQRQGAPQRDHLEYVEHDQDEMSSPLRKGTGVSIGPFFALHKWWTSDEASFGDGTTWSESVGLALRWSVSSSGALFVEAGYEHFNDTTVATLQGLTSQIGYEFRIPLDYDYGNQFLIAPGIGYEFVQYTPQDASQPSANGGALVPRLRLGWRHMLTQSSSFDLALDGGAKAVTVGGNYLNDQSGPSVVLLALNVAVHWGF